MSGLMNAVVVVAVTAVVIACRLGARRIGSERLWWIAPAVLAVVAMREPGVIDSHHQAGASFLPGTAALIFGLVTTLPVHSGLPTRRVRSLRPTVTGRFPAYGVGVGRVLREECA
ncbi:hypothetical protein [Streptomyces sp. NPDC058751]|uniref:hypothetical protein n=1 Tax=Streptomyces sp. NPDC058751 TaxID=3346623 RepID=UPI00367EF48B